MSRNSSAFIETLVVPRNKFALGCASKSFPFIFLYEWRTFVALPVAAKNCNETRKREIGFIAKRNRPLRLVGCCLSFGSRDQEERQRRNFTRNLNF